MESSKELDRALNLLLDISSILMCSGANTNRIQLTIKRFASVLNYKASSLVSHKTIILTLTDNESNFNRTKTQNIPGHAINFSSISAISHLGWQAIDENMTIEAIEVAVEDIKKRPPIPNYIKLIAVSLAGAGFCKIFGGDYLNMLVAFVSTLAGRYFFVVTTKKKFNVYIRVFLASFVASMLASVGVIYNIGANPQTALATSVLFLVPGVALINSFTDMMDNNVLNGMVRFANGVMTVIAITMGLFLVLVIFQLKV